MSILIPMYVLQRLVKSVLRQLATLHMRNNWVTMMFKTKCNYNCFQKQSHIDTCTNAFRDFERFGFEFRDFGFTGCHVHFPVNIPKRYSVEEGRDYVEVS